jgi:hypothetical protein
MCLICFLSRSMAYVGPLEQPSLAWEARSSASQARIVRASLGQLQHPDAVCPAVEAVQRDAGAGQITAA